MREKLSALAYLPPELLCAYLTVAKEILFHIFQIPHNH